NNILDKVIPIIEYNVPANVPNISPPDIHMNITGKKKMGLNKWKLINKIGASSPPAPIYIINCSPNHSIKNPPFSFHTYDKRRAFMTQAIKNIFSRHSRKKIQVAV